MNIQQKRTIKVLENMLELVKDDEDYANFFADAMNPMLEDLLCNDAFGTEGQSDPRGDGREGRYTMYHVMGVDE